MKNILTLIKNNLRILVIKKPVYTVMMIIVPIVCCIVFSSLLSHNSSPLKLGVIDYSNSSSSNIIINGLVDNGTLEKVDVNEDSLLESFTNKDINAAVVFSKDFETKLLNGDTSGITIKGLENENIYSIVSQIVGGEVSNLKKLALVNNKELTSYKKSLENYQTSKVTISKESLGDLKNDYGNSQAVVGFLIMFTLLRAMNTASLIGEDKQQKIYTRILTSPVKEWEYYVANFISNFIILLTQIGVSLVGITLVNNMNFGIGLGSIFLILSAVAFVAIGLGSFCVTITDSRDLSNIIANFLLMGTLFLGGCFVPVSIFSSTVNKISFLTPARWAMDGVIKLQDGLALSDISMNFVILLLFGVALMLVSVYFVKSKDKVNSIA